MTGHQRKADLRTESSCPLKIASLFQQGASDVTRGLDMKYNSLPDFRSPRNDKILEPPRLNFEAVLSREVCPQSKLCSSIETSAPLGV